MIVVGMELKRFFWSIIGGSFVAIALTSCSGDMLSKAAGVVSKATNPTSTEVDTTGIMNQVADGELTKLWKEPIVFPLDTLNPVREDSIAKYIKKEKRRRRDSLRVAFDMRPKHIYFTFDDGPLVGSKAIDSIISSKNIKISAFLVGRHTGMSKNLHRSYERYMANTLIECYNHSFTHAKNKFSVFYSNPVSAFEDFSKNETDLSLTHKIVRMPGRNIWMYDDMRRIDLQSGASTADLLFSEGYKIYGWDVEWKIHGLTGKPIQSVDEIYNRITNYMNNKTSMEPNNVVLLMHDDMFQAKNGQRLLSSLIDTLKQNTDYSFEFMSSYPFRY